MKMMNNSVKKTPSDLVINQ
jgi:hypothetical protein